MAKTILLSLALALLPSARAELKVHIIDVGQAASALVELDHAALLIDAGGEDTTPAGRDARSIQDALTAFFARRTDLHNILEAVIISHPHIDHTMNLLAVMQGFTVRQLIENGDTNKNASGMPPLAAARAFAKSHQIPDVAIKDKDVPAGGMPLALSPDAASSAQITILSGYRGCKDANNDSIAVLIRDGNASALFAGDSENKDTSGACKKEPQLQHLLNRFGDSGLLSARMYVSTHHGSDNGVLAAEVEKVHPEAAIISAGRLDPANRVPGAFHAFQYGHPRKDAIDSLVANTTGSRPAKEISFMAVAGSSHPDATPSTMQMENAVYCTCWDGNIDVTFDADGHPVVTPLAAQHTPAPATTTTPDTPPPPPPPAPASCKIADSDIFKPSIKAPDYVNQKTADYYMLSLSWSPEFCTTSAGASSANRFQCQENSFGMVVHGLWPQSSDAQNDKQHPRNCKTTTPIAPATIRRELCTQPGVQLIQDEWAKHGTCAFNTPESYIDAIQKLVTQLQVPDLEALAGNQGSSLTAKDVIAAFVNRNPGLQAPDVQLLLGGKSLQEVHICYSLDLVFRPCDTTSSVKNTTKVTIRPKAKSQ